MQILVKTLLDTTIPLKVNPWTSILSVKGLLEGEMPCDCQRLVFNGKPLEDAHTLSNYNIQEGATIHLVLHLKSNSQGPKDPKRAIWS
jgi:hypothetical protein